MLVLSKTWWCNLQALAYYGTFKRSLEYGEVDCRIDQRKVTER